MITYYQGRKYQRFTHVRRDEITRAVVLGTSGSFSIRSHGRRHGRNYGMDDDTLVKAAEQCLTRPGSFAYFGNYPMFESWGYSGIGQSRDSDALERSNYRRIFQDMTARHPDEDTGDNILEWVSDFRASHWAVGWVESVIVRVLYDADEDITPANITSAFRDIAGIAEYLHSDYPVYDESDYSELESEEREETFESEWRSLVWGWDDDEGPEPWEGEKDGVFEYLRDTDRYYESFDSDDMLEGIRERRSERIYAAKAAVKRILAR